MEDKPVNQKGQTLEEFLASYNADRYRHPSLTVDVVLFTIMDEKLKLLLIRRRNHPWIGQWALPGGFCEFGESLEEALKRELEEETGLSGLQYYRQLYTFSKKDRDPRTHVVSTAYLCMIPQDQAKAVSAGDDAADVCWFTISKETVSMDEEGRLSALRLYSAETETDLCYEIRDHARNNYIETDSGLVSQIGKPLASDHIKAVNMAMDILQHRAAGTGILFNLLPEKFTLRQVQTVYEAVVGHRTDTANFRRDIRKMLKETGFETKINGRKTALYEFNPMFTYVEENL